MFSSLMIDTSTSLIAFVSCYLSGHGKFETLGALGISCMLLATAGGIAWHAVDVLLVRTIFLFSSHPKGHLSALLSVTFCCLNFKELKL